MISRHSFRILAPLIALVSCLGTALAQQVTGTLGAPGATSMAFWMPKVSC